MPLPSLSVARRAAPAAAVALVIICSSALLPFSVALSPARTARLTETSIRNGPGGLGAPASGNGEGPERISGFFKLDRTEDAHMFYFLFQSRSMKPDDPVVLWMTENGPWTVTDDLTLEETPYGWDVSNTMIYVDQPINTGFSYSSDDRDRVYDEEKVASDMMDFLQELYSAHPELAGRDFFVTGESYAGHYVPAVTRAVYDARNNGTLTKDINLKGFAIGNGLTDPAIQYGAYADFSLENGLIDEDTYNNVQWYYPSCKSAIEVCNKQGWAAECRLAVTFCQAGIVSRIMSAAGDFNVYDIRLPCIGPLCYDFSNVDNFLNLPSTREWLGVGDMKWEECDMSVHDDMMGDWMRDYELILPEMLDNGIRGLIYAGDQDFICNWVGNARWVDAMRWSGADKYNKTSPVDFEVDGEVAWSVRTADSLSFMKVFGAGHMVPMDKPKQAMLMINKFTRNEPFTPSSSMDAPKLFQLRRMGVSDEVAKDLS